MTRAWGRAGDTIEPTQSIGRYIAELHTDSIPAEIRHRAKLTILDTVGVSLAACRYPIAQRLQEYVDIASPGTGPSRIVGAGQLVPASVAAMVNGTLANALDFDEGPHLATHVWPAVLALGEQLGSPGADVLDAYIVGREIGARLTRCLDAQRFNKGGPTSRGWWHVGLVGPLAAAAAAARLLGLVGEQAATAIALATCRAGGQRSNMGTMGKALHSGNSAAAGIEAAQLAAVGFTAAERILESPLGFARALCHDDECDWNPVAQPWTEFELAGGVRIKPYPACTPIHAVIDAAVELHTRGIRADEIERVVANLHPFSLLRDDPRDAMEAGFSGRYILAASLLHGRFDLDLVTDEAVGDPGVRRLMGRIVHDAHANGVTIWTIGERCDSVVAPSRRRLVEPVEIEAKFRRCADPVVGQAIADRMIGQVMELERIGVVSNLSLSAEPGGVSVKH
jgi:2-methylcitrate dehydratase PrpD